MTNPSTEAAVRIIEAEKNFEIQTLKQKLAAAESEIARLLIKSDVYKARERIVKDPAPILRQIAEPVDQSEDIQSLVYKMLNTLKKTQDIGLSAPQVGVSKRVIVVQMDDEGMREPVIMINPEIIWVSDTISCDIEGCLSIEGKYYFVRRPQEVQVRFTDLAGVIYSERVHGLTAKCVQHEIDHLDGILIKDKGNIFGSINSKIILSNEQI